MTAPAPGPASPVGTAVARVRSVLARSEVRTDGQLLAAFRDARDPDAFTALVYRHGPRVLGVCRRITGHDHDADDACQAVFLVLARRAADIRPPDAVGAWLHGVAFRTAQDARVMSARRRAKVAPAADLPDMPVESDAPDLELAVALDAEIAKLPDAHRAAVVLCELDGLPRKDAAARLGIAEGTLSSRLADARKRLAAGLRRKGFALPAVLATALPACGSETVFPLACRLGQLAAAGEQLPTGVPVALADVVTKAMFLKKLSAVAVLAVFACLLLAGWLTFRDAFADEPKPARPKAEQPKPAPAKPLNKMLIWKQGEAYLLAPDGKDETRLFERGQGEAIREPHLSPDGKTLAYLTNTFEPGKPIDPEVAHRASVALRAVGGKDATVLDVIGTRLAWSPDGKELLAAFAPNGGPGPRDAIPPTTTTVIDVATKKATVLTLPAGHFAQEFAPDGKGLVTMFVDNTGKNIVLCTCLVSRDGKEVKTISDPAYGTLNPRLSPDGRTLLFVGLKLPGGIPDKPIDRRPLLHIQPIGGKVAELPDVPLNAEIQTCCWSPDGKKIAYTWRQIHAEKGAPGKPDERETESHLCVCDADGKNHKTILSEKGKGAYVITLGNVDWR
jgi:RNA polymerase sigma factor (sigma-70 family)